MSQQNLNKNASVWASQTPDKIRSTGMTDSPNQASIQPCTKKYELPQECLQHID